MASELIKIPRIFDKVYVIADNHLGYKKNDILFFTRFIRSFPETTQPFPIVFLGDFFHIWALDKNYHTPEVKKVLQSLHELTEKGFLIFFVLGNRDLLSVPFNFRKNVSPSCPFHCVSHDYLEVKLNTGKKILFHHGDLLNSKDYRYRIWRFLVRSAIFRLSVYCFSTEKVKAGLLKGESEMKKTNMKFRHDFPSSEWERYKNFLIKKFDFDVFLCGHYHPESMVENEQGKQKFCILPAWLDSPIFFEINSEANIIPHSAQALQKGFL